MYCKEYVIEYTQKYYNINIKEDADSFFFDYNKNVYEVFKENNPLETKDDRSREWFNKYGRKRYYKFYNQYKESEGVYDLIQDWFLKADVLHHIYPLVFGGSNDLTNLLPTTTMFHNILHRNPRESEETQCYRAVDYLSYLIRPDTMCKLYDQYDLDKYKENEELMNMFITDVLNYEMQLFYDKENTYNIA